MILNYNKRISFYFFSILLVLVLFSCENKNHDFYVPKIPLKSGFEELGNSKQSNLKYDFELFKYEYIINLLVKKEIYNQTALLTKTMLVKEGEELSSKKFYNLFLHDKKDIVILKNILNQINKRSIGKDFDEVQVIVNFVQSIPYEEAKEQKYPIETLYLNKGDCSDKSILLAKLLDLAGFNTCLFVFNNAKHMAVGIASDDKESAYRSGYIYIESTGYNPIGDIPKEFAGGIKIEEEPEILTITRGRNPVTGFKKLQKMYKAVEFKYGENYFTTNKKGKIILESISQLDLELKSLNKLISKKHNEILIIEKILIDNNCSGVLGKEKYNYCLTVQNSANNKNRDYNNLIDAFNKKNEIRNRRVQIINEINKNNYIKIK